MRLEKFISLFILISIGVGNTTATTTPNYEDALSKSLVFFEAQRSGKLPHTSNLSWRASSGLNHGSQENVDLTGGYYDAGDNVKFGLPMAFTTTMLAWSVIEFGKKMGHDLHNARDAVKWGSDYLLKASCHLPNALYVQVGNPNDDHKCWMRAEDVKTPPPVYKVTPSNPGSEVAGETAAALAAASIVFRGIDAQYSKKLENAAVKAFTFADKYRGNYSESLSSAVCPFYCSYSGFQDELLWAAAWLHKATKNPSYLNYAKSLGCNADSDSFSWDNKYPGARVLLTKEHLLEKNQGASEFRDHAERFMCSVLPGSPSMSVKYTPGGLLYKMTGSNLQYVTTSSFLMLVYSKYLLVSKQSFKCGDMSVDHHLLRQVAKKQVDYILGVNPKGMSYMVGYSSNFPRRIHHRDSSIPCTNILSGAVSCDAGFQYLHSSGPNPNVLTGAVVGGPDENDNFADDRENYAQSEPATYINAPLVGTLAYMAASVRN
ncbi:Endoglucanase [Rhynchospora pubera]|uniref:Endoglucanase n=1 Tax=Rhynchospora pubera TaxID=906938 RepID=A0AAV8CSW8_9POAL|nr:Endoglucanase [Rhynchospora pubera]